MNGFTILLIALLPEIQNQAYDRLIRFLVERFGVARLWSDGGSFIGFQRLSLRTSIEPQRHAVIDKGDPRGTREGERQRQRGGEEARDREKEGERDVISRSQRKLSARVRVTN